MSLKKIICADNVPDVYPDFDPKNLVLDETKIRIQAKGNLGGAFIPVRYMYDNRQDCIRIQTSELFSHGFSCFINKGENSGFPKISLGIPLQDSLLNHKKSLGEDLTEAELETLNIQNKTLNILKAIETAIKQELKSDRCFNAYNTVMQKKNITRECWDTGVSLMTLITPYTKNGTTNQYINPKAFNYRTDDKQFATEMEFGNKKFTYEDIEKFKQSFRGIMLCIIDSVYILPGKLVQFHPQFKISHVVITELIAPKQEKISYSNEVRRKLEALTMQPEEIQETPIEDGDHAKQIIDVDSDDEKTIT